MNVAALLRARTAPEKRPPVGRGVFLEGIALLARETPELRRAYVKLPWPQLYEYRVSVAWIAYEREREGERAVLLSHIKGPERYSIPDLEALIHAARSRPVLGVKELFSVL